MINMIEVQNSEFFCSGCEDLCAVITNLSSFNPRYCIKSSQQAPWKKAKVRMIMRVDEV